MILCLPVGVKRNSRLFRALLHVLILASAAAPAAGQVFKWVDERGITHYGERPPQGAKATEVPDKLASPPGRGGGTATKEGLPVTPPPHPNNPSPAAKAPPPQPGNSSPAAKAPAPPTPEQQQAAARAAQCQQERATLLRLRSGGTSYSLNEKGERTTIDNSQAIAEQEKRIAEQCGS